MKSLLCTVVMSIGIGLLLIGCDGDSSQPKGERVAKEPVTLDQLPPELRYLKTPALKYGGHQFGADIGNFLQNATDEEMMELHAVGATVKENDHYPAIIEWINNHDMPESEEVSQLYFLFGILDEANITFD